VNTEPDALLTSFVTLQFLHNGRFSVQTFFITRKSLGGHAETYVSSLFLKLIKCHVVDKADLIATALTGCLGQLDPIC